MREARPPTLVIDSDSTFGVQTKVSVIPMLSKTNYILGIYIDDNNWAKDQKLRPNRFNIIKKMQYVWHFPRRTAHTYGRVFACKVQVCNEWGKGRKRRSRSGNWPITVVWWYRALLISHLPKWQSNQLLLILTYWYIDNAQAWPRILDSRGSGGQFLWRNPKTRVFWP